ncbi:hypothetical protein BD779DRAFT_1551585, partial [Infundibulicybe gibba]
ECYCPSPPHSRSGDARPRDGHIPSLLRHGTIGTSRALGLEIRQSGCAFAGDFECADGKTYCDVGGCCDNGETCVASGGTCPHASDVECIDGCCPAGWTCSGATKCSPPTVAGATFTRTVTTSHRTATATSLTNTGFPNRGPGSVSGATGSIGAMTVIAIAASFFAL